MAEWLFTAKGFPARSGWDMIRNNRGYVIGWIFGSNVHSSHGEHIGWFEAGHLRHQQLPASLCRNHTAYLSPNPALRHILHARFASPPAGPAS